MFKKAISLIISFSLLLTQPVFAQGAAELNIGKYLGQMPALQTDSFRPARLRYISYDVKSNDFKLLLDPGDSLKGLYPQETVPDDKLKQSTQELFNYFLIGLSLPNDKFWVNLRPDAPEQIIDPELEKTDLGKIMLEADLQLKKDTAGLTSPQNPEGKAYWDKLYKRAGELFGAENITIPTITRPWIVPGEVIIRESEDASYIYKANLKVMLEEDHLKSPGHQGTSHQYNFSDPRMKELNEYSTQLIKELILPRLTQEVNTGKRYAGLRQVFFSLILSRWFKDRYSKVTMSQGHQSPDNSYTNRIDSGNLTNLTSKEAWSKDYYFNEYKKSFQEGEYKLKEEIATPTGQVIRSYVSGGIRPVLERKEINSFQGVVGANSPIGLSLPVVLVVGGSASVISIYATYRAIRFSNREKRRKLVVIRESIERVLKYADKDLLAGEDAMLLDEEFKNYETFTLEKTIRAVRNVIGRLQLRFEEPTYASFKETMRQNIIDVLQKSLEEVSDTAGSSPLTQKEARDEFDKYLKYLDRQYGDDSSADKKVKDCWRKIYIKVFVFNFNIDTKKDLEVIESAIRGLRKDAEEIKAVSNDGLVEDLEKLIGKFQSWVNIAWQEYCQKRIDKVVGMLSDSDLDVPGLNKIAIEVLKILQRYIADGDYNIDMATVGGINNRLEKNSGMGYFDKFRVYKAKAGELTVEEKLLAEACEEYLNKSSSSLTQDLPQNADYPLLPGGIDFTRINYLTRPMGSFQGLDLRLPFLSKTELEGIDINKELASVEQMVNAKIEVSTDRLKRLLAAMRQKDAFSAQRETQLLPLLLRLCWLKEERGTETTPEFRSVLLIADSGLFVEQGKERYSLN